MKIFFYSQFLTVRRICTKTEDFTKHSKSMSQHFRDRGYPKNLLKRALTECSKKSQEELITPKTKQPETEQNDNLYFVNTFRPCKNSLVDTIKRNWDILGRSKSTKNIHRSTLITSFKRPKNLRDYLVSAKTDYKSNTFETENK